ncbi:MAG: WbuC family cupin fold metalloprotein [Planctomycetales bacterium]|nr:WbuC family cupin fold metalloprotein [Planctomycetales bacterium]
MSHKPNAINVEMLDSLCSAAQSNERLRAHLNLHESLDDPFQRMVVGMEPASYIRPHRHLITPKPENIVALRGRLGAVFFDDAGNVTETVEMIPNGISVGVDIPAGTWHSIVCLESNTAFLESKPGPYVPFEPDDFAPWAPAAGPEASAYSSQLRQLFCR